MATLRNKRKLAAVSRETPESNRGSRGQNVLDPELTQDYISQVSEEIEGRVTKKLSKEFNKTESRILGALSKLDEFLLNPQVRTCSVTQGASKSANPENGEIHGDRSLNDPYPEGGCFPHHSGQLNSPEADMVTEPYSNLVTQNYSHSISLSLNIEKYQFVDNLHTNIRPNFKDTIYRRIFAKSIVSNKDQSVPDKFVPNVQFLTPQNVF